MGLRRSRLVVVWLIGATVMLPNASIAPAIPEIADAFGISNQTSVFILMTAHAPDLFMASVIGVAADRYGRRRVHLRQARPHLMRPEVGCCCWWSRSRF